MLACMNDSCAQLYEDLPNPNNFHWWHDALIQMNNPTTKQWMHDHDMLHHWILPESGCNAGARYSTHPPGNTTEAMPLDYNLFKDWNDGLERHVLLTRNLDDEDPKNFSLTTPKRIASAMERVWDSIPTSAQVAQDVNRVMKVNTSKIIEHGGVIAPGLGNRKGERDINLKVCSPNLGSKRKKKVGMVLDPWIHPDAAQSKAVFISKAIKVKEEQKAKKIVVGFNDNSLEELSVLTNS